MCFSAISDIIVTERLRLDLPVAGDAHRIAQFASDPAVARMTSSLPHPYGREDAEAFIGKVRALPPGREAVYAVRLQDQLIGVLGLHANAGRLELGYWYGRPYWGRGYATEAAIAALAWTRDHRGSRYVMARHFTDNPASGEVLCKAGFLYTGEVVRLRSPARDSEAPARTMVWIA